MEAFLDVLDVYQQRLVRYHVEMFVNTLVLRDDAPRKLASLLNQTFQKKLINPSP